MSLIDSILRAIRAGFMTDTKLADIFHEIIADRPLTDFQPAMQDEAQMPKILSDSDVSAIFGDAPLPMKSLPQ